MTNLQVDTLTLTILAYKMTLTETRRSKLINILNSNFLWSTRKPIFLTLTDNGLYRYHYKSFLRKSRAIAYNMGLRKSQIRKFLQTCFW